MSDQELLDRIAQGDQTALTELCDRYAELIRKQAQWIARQYNCLRPGSHGGWSDYTKETLSELESVGRLALIECVRNGGYDSSKGAFGTYVVPFLDGAMRRLLEASMGTLSLDRDSMGLVRKAQMLYHRDGKEMSEIAGELGVSLAEVAKAVAYPTHFFSVYDLPIPEEDGDIFEYLSTLVWGNGTYHVRPLSKITQHIILMTGSAAGGEGIVRERYAGCAENRENTAYALPPFVE